MGRRADGLNRWLHRSAHPAEKEFSEEYLKELIFRVAHFCPLWKLPGPSQRSFVIGLPMAHSKMPWRSS